MLALAASSLRQNNVFSLVMIIMLPMVRVLFQRFVQCGAIIPKVCARYQSWCAWHHHHSENWWGRYGPVTYISTWIMIYRRSSPPYISAQIPLEHCYLSYRLFYISEEHIIHGSNLFSIPLPKSGECTFFGAFKSTYTVRVEIEDFISKYI